MDEMRWGAILDSRKIRSARPGSSNTSRGAVLASLGDLAVVGRVIPKDHVFTLGIEEEFAIVDPQTRELRSHIQEILEEDGRMKLKEQIKPEMYLSVVESAYEICQSIVDARSSVIALRTQLAELSAKGGMKVASAGTHPFSHWAISSSRKASATRRSSKTCNRSRGRT